MAAKVTGPYDPPLAFLGQLASQTDGVVHAFLKADQPSFCGLEPRWRTWHASDVLTRPAVAHVKRMCSGCRDLVIEQAIVRSLQRLGGRATFEPLLQNIPWPRPSDKQVGRAVNRMVGRHEVGAYILPGDYPNLIEYRLD